MRHRWGPGGRRPVERPYEGDGRLIVVLAQWVGPASRGHLTRAMPAVPGCLCGCTHRSHVGHSVARCVDSGPPAASGGKFTVSHSDANEPHKNTYLGACKFIG